MTHYNYHIRYLPFFFDDLNDITSYIKNELSNLKAANDLVDAIDDEGPNKVMEVRRSLFNKQDMENII